VPEKLFDERIDGDFSSGRAYPPHVAPLAGRHASVGAGTLNYRVSAYAKWREGDFGRLSLHTSRPILPHGEEARTAAAADDLEASSARLRYSCPTNFWAKSVIEITPERQHRGALLRVSGSLRN
jgi:hypothetical protein